MAVDPTDHEEERRVRIEQVLEQLKRQAVDLGRVTRQNLEAAARTTQSVSRARKTRLPSQNP